jgi:hypothetical protein
MGKEEHLLRSPTHLALPRWNQHATLPFLPDDAVHFHHAHGPALHTCKDPEKGALSSA